MPIALAIALIAHAALIAGLEQLVLERPPRSTEPRALMVISQPGGEPSTAAVIAAHTEPAEVTQARPPETVAANATERREAATAEHASRTSELPPEPAQEPRPPAQAASAAVAAPSPAIPATAASALIATATDLTVDDWPEPDSESEPESEPTPERTQPNAAAALLEADAIEASPERPSISAADIFASRSAEVASLATAKTKEQNRANASDTRRKAISSATRDYLYANYLQAWQRKAERIGNLNYPREARELGLYGTLSLHVAVRSDGTLEGIRVVRSSGHEVLDQAAVRIVELAAPFAPFPPGIKRKTDVLDITVPWQFQRNHRLSWGR